MRWEGRRQSDNIEDRRGMRPVTIAGGGLGTLILILIVLFLGGDPRALLQQQQGGPGGAVQQGQVDPAQEPLKEFVATVLADTEDVWNDLFAKMGKQYREPTLVLFSDRVQSACGIAGAAVGPFYCPADQKLYIDLAFYDELRDRLGAPGDFAQAYVIAHEVGHHVQNQLGIAQQVDAARQRLSPAEANELSVRMELQADFFAGVWAHHAQRMKHILDEEDIEEGLNAAAAIGDDRLQMEAQGYVRPDAFTHGTSEQRVRWFKKGLETGDPSQGDTFNAARL
ncbi:MAG: neutral zinc metallopeptidase [Pirellulales bacterium]